MNCKYIWYNLPNTIKTRLVLDAGENPCVSNIETFNELASKAIWYNLPGRLNAMCAILELPIVVTWNNMLKSLGEICDYIDNLTCE